MKKVSSKAVTLWIVAFLIFVSSFSIIETDKGPFFSYLLVSAGLAFWGWRVKDKKSDQQQELKQPEDRQKPKYRYPSHAVLIPYDSYGFWDRSLRNIKATLKIEKKEVAVYEGRYLVGYLFDGSSKDHAKEWLKKGWPYEAHFLDGKIYEDIRGDVGKIALYFYASSVESK